ncbi:uncharacterized protein LOC124141264 [Haliotis rufescens]|uniref:uncharacterized protein LOC124141264 n=1 Tax=Haliotis rufescens TaxID=6454 RepID=UPI001EB06F2C|nr:uncharacterized protein LOC124141264 [Haliotis rufescens]
MMNDVPTENSALEATHCHQSALGEIDKMNKELEQLKEDLFKTRVKSHILHVDLATQFSPHMVEKLSRVKEDCNRCSMTVNMHLQADQK